MTDDIYTFTLLNVGKRRLLVSLQLHSVPRTVLHQSPIMEAVLAAHEEPNTPYSKYEDEEDYVEFQVRPQIFFCNKPLRIRVLLEPPAQNHEERDISVKGPTYFLSCAFGNQEDDGWRQDGAATLRPSALAGGPLSVSDQRSAAAQPRWGHTKPQDPSRVVHVRNLPDHAHTFQIEDLFARHGEVDEVVRIKNKSQAPNQALVQMKTIEGSHAAVEGANVLALSDLTARDYHVHAS